MEKDDSSGRVVFNRHLYRPVPMFGAPLKLFQAVRMLVLPSICHLKSSNHFLSVDISDIFVQEESRDKNRKVTCEGFQCGRL